MNCDTNNDDDQYTSTHQLETRHVVVVVGADDGDRWFHVLRFNHLKIEIFFTINATSTRSPSLSIYRTALISTLSGRWHFNLLNKQRENPFICELWRK